MDEISNFYVERIAVAARQTLIENGIILADTRIYTRSMLEKIVDFFGGKIIFENDEQTESKSNEKTYITKTAEESFEIHINKSEEPEKLFMKVIHELGHAFITPMKVGDKQYCDGRKSTDVQANLFARAFVMPAADFIESAKTCIVAGKFDIQKIADIYHVEYVDALIRGKELNYWE